MHRHIMKKWTAVILSLVMILACAAASAGTVTVQMTADREAMGNIPGIPEGLKPVLDPILSLINVLGVKVTTVQDGVQADLELKGESALSFSYASDGQEIRLASTLFPNYLLTLKRDTLPGMAGALIPGIPADGTGEAGEGAVSVLPGYVPAWAGTFAQSCGEAVVPGEPVKGEYSFDGYSFDTMVPVTVDTPSVKAAFRTMKEEMMKDEGFLASLQQSAGTAGMTLTPEKIREKADAFEAHLPDTVTAEYYLNEDHPMPVFITGRAGYDGKEGPSFEYSLLYRDEKNGRVTMLDHDRGISAGIDITDGSIRLEARKGEQILALDFRAEAGEPAVYLCDVYFNQAPKPLASIRVTVSAEGERTLSADAGNKTVLAMEDLLSGKGDAGKGFLSDLLMNGLSPLMMKLNEAAPEAAALIAMLMMPQQDAGKAAVPEASPAPQETADPSSWKTLADVLSLQTESREATWDDESYILIIRYAGTEWMMQAEFSPELKDAVMAVDVMAEDRNEQINAILGPCRILKVVDLRTLALPQEELDRWIGKTGKDLLDAGWEYNGYHSDETGIHVCMVNGEFQYRIAFAEEMKMTGSFGDQPENMPSAVITGVTFDGKSYNFNEKAFFAEP